MCPSILSPAASTHKRGSPTKCAIYTRVSTEEPAKGRRTLAVQGKRLRCHAKENHG